MKTCAELLEYIQLLVKLCSGVEWYNYARKIKSKGLNSTGEEEVTSRTAFTELVMYIEEARYSDKDQAPVFKLSDLVQLYESQNRAFWSKTGYECTHNTTQAMSKRGEMSYLHNRTLALHWPKRVSCDSKTEAIHLTNGAKIVRGPLLGSQQDVQKNLCHPYCLS